MTAALPLPLRTVIQRTACSAAADPYRVSLSWGRTCVCVRALTGTNAATVPRCTRVSERRRRRAYDELRARVWICVLACSRVLAASRPYTHTHVHKYCGNVCFQFHFGVVFVLFAPISMCVAARPACMGMPERVLFLPFIHTYNNHSRRCRMSSSASSSCIRIGI